MAKRRTSILLEPDLYERYVHRARQKGTTVSEEIRRVLEEAVCDENPNQAWLDLFAVAEELAEPRDRDFPAADSDEAKEEMIRDIYRDAMNREPDW
jgi:hypothetical protein